MELYVRATSKVISRREPTYDSRDLWRFYSAAPMANQAVSMLAMERKMHGFESCSKHNISYTRHPHILYIYIITVGVRGITHRVVPFCAHSWRMDRAFRSKEHSSERAISNPFYINVYEMQ